MRSPYTRAQSTPLLLLLALSLCATAAAQLETRGTFAAQTYPYPVAVGDFNHDGKLDLAVAATCCPSGGILILLGNGDGTFGRARSYGAGSSPEFVVAADFNHDGNLDLAVTSQSSYISILLGNGDGTFQPATQTPTVPTFEKFVAVGDFNGDGKLDLVARSDSSVISVLMGNGDGTFQNAITTTPPFSVTAIGVGDFNSDGKLDLATAGTFGSTSSVNILLGNGDGTFQYGASYPGDTSPISIAVGDFNGDHNLDLAIDNSEGVGISVLLGTGDGTFQAAVNYPIPFNLWVTAADINGDHKVDLVVVNIVFSGNHSYSGVTVFPGNGDGTFQQPGTFYPAGVEAEYVAVGDFNGDRRKDLVIVDLLSSDVIALLNTGTVTFSPTTPLNFQKQTVGTTSAPQTVTLTNTGTTTLNISSMKATGQFGMTSTCASSVAAGANCAISVTFSPKSKGAKAGTVTINDSASSKPMVIELSGTGT